MANFKCHLHILIEWWINSYKFCVCCHSGSYQALEITQESLISKKEKGKKEKEKKNGHVVNLAIKSDLPNVQKCMCLNHEPYSFIRRMKSCAVFRRAKSRSSWSQQGFWSGIDRWASVFDRWMCRHYVQFCYCFYW